MRKGRIKAAGVSARCRRKPSLTPSPLRGKNDRCLTTISRKLATSKKAPAVRSGTSYYRHRAGRDAAPTSSIACGRPESCQLHLGTPGRINSECRGLHLVRGQDCPVLGFSIRTPSLSTEKAASIDQFRQRESQIPPTKIRSRASTSFQGS
jgi:hypothetical protein